MMVYICGGQFLRGYRVKFSRLNRFKGFCGFGDVVADAVKASFIPFNACKLFFGGLFFVLFKIISRPS